MATSDLLAKDLNAASFAPETTDQGTNSAGINVKRAMYGCNDGANVALGATGNSAWSGTGSGTLISILMAGVQRLMGIGGASVPITPANISTSTASSVVAVATATPILVANVLRKRYSIYNDSTSIAYVLEGAGTVSATNYSYQLTAGGYASTTEWAGAVSALWATSNGAARVTEYTP